MAKRKAPKQTATKNKVPKIAVPYQHQHTDKGRKKYVEHESNEHSQRPPIRDETCLTLAHYSVVFTPAVILVSK